MKGRCFRRDVHAEAQRLQRTDISTTKARRAQRIIIRGRGFQAWRGTENPAGRASFFLRVLGDFVVNPAISAFSAPLREILLLQTVS
jgi:hypothetical protein